jgi:alkylated DNA repair dioxygenase AlkB
MLFSRAGGSTLPSFLTGLIGETERLLSDRLPPEVMTTLFSQPLARQVILNMYPPGEGISPHIDLPGRYADGIVGISLTGGCVMVFAKGGAVHHMYLPPRTVYVLTGPARWEWGHGIAPRREDMVEDEDEDGVRVRVQTVLRDLRVSATFRWMKPGADVLS